MKNQAVEEDLKWSTAALRISSETLLPEEIEEVLGLKATNTHTKGTSRSRRHTAVWKASLWSLESPLGDHNEMADHLGFLLDLLESKADALIQLSEQCKIDFFCGFSSNNGQGGFELDTTTLSRLAGISIPIVFDLYPPPAENDEAGQADGAGPRGE